MATYKEIHGIAVKDQSSDPTTTGELFIILQQTHLELLVKHQHGLVLHL